MKVLSLEPGTKSLRLDDQPAPVINHPDDVKLQVLEVGICGTDREEAAGGRADAPAGETAPRDRSRDVRAGGRGRRGG